MRFRIFRGDRRSSGALALARALRASGHRCLMNSRGRPWRVPDDATVINWGRSDCPNTGRVWNPAEAVTVAADKLLTARLLHGLPTPAWTDSKAEAEQWLAEGTYRRVVARQLLRGSQGRGTYVCTRDTGLPDAPLYLEYVPKAREYRVHVVRGRVVDVQQKRKRREVPNEEVNYEIRNARYGWVFCREDVTPPPGAALEAALAAVRSLTLDFGAVDLGVTEKDNRVTIYEVNTAPGLEGTTLERYVEGFAYA